MLEEMELLCRILAAKESGILAAKESGNCSFDLPPMLKGAGVADESVTLQFLSHKCPINDKEKTD